MMELLGRLGPFVAGALVAYVLLPTDPVTYTDVVVPAARIIEREAPDRPPTIIERIRYVNVPPAQVATATGGAAQDVARFCRPVVLAHTDTVEVPVADPMLLIRSVGLEERPVWNPLAKDQLFVAGPVSTGDLRAIDFDVRGSWDVRASGDSALVRYPRTSAIRDFVEAGAVLYTGLQLLRYAVGAVR